MNSYKIWDNLLYLFCNIKKFPCYCCIKCAKICYINNVKIGGIRMDKYKCVACGYIYDDAVEAVKFADLPEDWVCPLCGVPKSAFVKVEE